MADWERPPRADPCRYSLGLVIGRLADAVELLCAALLTLFALRADVVVHLLGLLFCDADAFAMIPVGTKVAADVEPSEETRR